MCLLRNKICKFGSNICNLEYESVNSELKSVKKKSPAQDHIKFRTRAVIISRPKFRIREFNSVFEKRESRNTE